MTTIQSNYADRIHAVDTAREQKTADDGQFARTLAGDEAAVTGQITVQESSFSGEYGTGGASPFELSTGTGGGSPFELSSGTGGGSPYDPEFQTGGASPFEIDNGTGGGSPFELSSGTGGGAPFEIEFGTGGASPYEPSGSIQSATAFRGSAGLIDGGTGMLFTGADFAFQPGQKLGANLAAAFLKALETDIADVASDR